METPKTIEDVLSIISDKIDSCYAMHDFIVQTGGSEAERFQNHGKIKALEELQEEIKGES